MRNCEKKKKLLLAQVLKVFGTYIPNVFAGVKIMLSFNFNTERLFTIFFIFVVILEMKINIIIQTVQWYLRYQLSVIVNLMVLFTNNQSNYYYYYCNKTIKS